MKIKYDFHIHTGLSPCALNEMTPNNIVNMSCINELDAIAITDHNSCGNCEAIMKLAKQSGIIAIPGLEVESKEEVHIVCLFRKLDDAKSMQKIVFEHLPNKENKPNILGEQIYFDEEDEVISYEKRLLSFATSLEFEEILEYVNKLQGIAIPAHIDRPSYSVLSNLAIIPSNSLIKTLELSRFADCKAYSEKYNEYKIIQSSDSHELGFIGICENYLDIKKEHINIDDIINYLLTKNKNLKNI